MLDFSHTPKPTASDLQIFVHGGQVASIGTNNWVQWQKPRGVTMTHILLVGAGGGGAGGENATGSANAAGGGSGSPGAVSHLIIPSMFLPDQLYIQLGAGGTGGASNTNGIIGGQSNIAIFPYNSATGNVNGYLLGADPGSFGTFSADPTGGGGATASAISTVAAGPLAGLGITKFQGGSVGFNGGTGTNAQKNGFDSNFNPSDNLLVCSGGGGGGANSTVFGTGGNIQSQYRVGSIVIPGGGTVNSTSLNGSGGLNQIKPILIGGIFGDMIMGLTGGSGGGGSFTGPGGDGGNGGYGCGGGGGGCGVPAGVGGRGGSGFCIIVSW